MYCPPLQISANSALSHSAALTLELGERETTPGACIVAVRFPLFGIEAVSGTKATVMNFFHSFGAAAKMQHCDTPAILELGSAGATCNECTSVTGFLLRL